METDPAHPLPPIFLGDACPTHLRFVGPVDAAPFHQLLERPFLNAVRLDECLYQVLWKHEDLLFCLRVEGPVVEFRKMRGCTMRFCSWYHLLLQQVKEDPLLYGPLTEASKDHVREWRDAPFLGTTDDVSFLQKLSSEDLEETLRPLQGMLDSPWGQSQEEGVRTCANISDDTDNARILACIPWLVESLVRIVMQSESCPTVRCAARSLGNILTWFQSESDLFFPLCIRLEAILTRRGTNPAWKFACREVERALRLVRMLS